MKEIVTISEFQQYSNVFSDNTELQLVYIQSAQNIISDYLGYDIEKHILNPATNQVERIKEIPEIIKLTIMRIATLLQSEADGNVGVNSKSFGEGGTRVFTNYTNFDKFLTPISKYRMIRV